MAAMPGIADDRIADIQVIDDRMRGLLRVRV